MRGITRPEVVVLFICLITVVALGFFALGPMFGGVDLTYSEGKRVGRIYKLSEKGMFWKTWEGELDLEMMEGSGNQVANKIWHFSVVSDTLVKQLEECMMRGDRVTLTYIEPWMMGWDEGQSGYLVIGIDVVTPRDPR